MRLLLPVLLALTAAPAAAQLSAPERKIVETVEQEQDRTIALLERMVNQNSGTMNLAGVRAVGEMARAELEPLGFDVRWVSGAESGRAGHLFATHKGNGRGKRMLLIGHLDTVFEPDSPFQRFERDGDRATGPGVGDDKGGVAVIIAALRAMHSAGTLRDADIIVALTGDEEEAGLPISASRGDLVAAAAASDVALDFENLSTDDGADIGSIARRSSGSWQVRATASGGHSSAIFSEGSGHGAIYELTRILDAFHEELPEPNLTFSVGLIAGGVTTSVDESGIRATASGKTNIIPEVAIAKGDIRTLSLEQSERVMATMRAIVSRHLPGASAELSFDEGTYPPMAPTEGNRALLARLNGVNADLGLAPMGELDPARRGAGDIGFVAHLVDGLVGLGASGGGSHAEGEYVRLDSLDRQAKRAAILMTRLSREKRP